MSLRTEWLPYGPEGQYSGYFAHQEGVKESLPAVLVVQEAGGVDAHIMDVTRRIASSGYAAFAPDLFAKHGTRPAPLYPERIREMLAFVGALPPEQRMDPKAREAVLTERPLAEGDRLRETMTTLFAGGFFPGLVAAATYLRTEQPVTRGQKIASVGFCMGGGLSALLASKDRELAGAVVFYGRSPPPEDIPGIVCPVLAFYGSRDKPLMDALPAFEAAMQKHGKRFEAVVYPGAEHAFFNDTRPLYHLAAARDAFVRTLGFLRQTLALA